MTRHFGTLVYNPQSEESIRVAAPTRGGIFYYAACVEPVARESDTNNNCSDAGRVIVAEAEES